MKKLFAILALAGIMAACNSDKKDEKKSDATTTTTTTNPNSTTTTTTTTTSSDVPKFSDPEVQQYVNDYSAYVTSIVAAYKSKDATKIADLSSKMSDWSSRSMTVGQKLSANPEEAAAFTKYITKLSQDMTAAMTGK